VAIWKNYTQNLQRSFVNIIEEEDQHIWSLNPTENYETKFGYKALLRGIEKIHKFGGARSFGSSNA
jgi:hypothetical protein